MTSGSNFRAMEIKASSRLSLSADEGGGRSQRLAVRTLIVTMVVFLVFNFVGQ